MNEDIEIQTGTILADKIKVDPSTISSLSERKVSALPHYQQKPITATSEAEKNWWKECYGGAETERGLRAEIPTLDDWSGEMSATLTFSPKKIDEIMNKLAGNEEEERYVYRKIKRQNQKSYLCRQRDDS